jgi:transposase-like protein
MPDTEGLRRRQFDDELKARAVRLVLDEGTSRAQ